MNREAQVYVYIKSNVLVGVEFIAKNNWGAGEHVEARSTRRRREARRTTGWLVGWWVASEDLPENLRCLV